MKKRLAALTSVTITVHATYVLGSSGTQSLGFKTVTIIRKNTLSNTVMLRSS